ncbi:MAG: aspartate racemase [Actinomycetota bacterium]|jgi:aspartate racemase|nr:aspartate racemase [Actinomycetota bacterium]
MKTIGVLGGMSSVATGEYYRLINEGVNERQGGHTSAELVLYSVDFGLIEGFIRNEQWDRAADYLAERARRVERAGAELLILATNTMHRVADEVQSAIGIPLLHIVDATADAAGADGASTLGVLGTLPVMEADFYRQRFAKLGFEVLVPTPDDRAVVHRVIFEELTRGIVDDQSRQEYQRIIRDLVARGADGIVLGCTEISLLVAPEDAPGTALYDTTALHVDQAVRTSLGLRSTP